jgi:beta-galactosidase
MKRTIAYLILALMLPTIKVFAQNSGQTILFDSNWRFHKGDVGHGEAMNFNDESWRQLDLPHDWSIEGTYSKQWASGTAFLPGGIGWYRKTFTVPALNKNKKIYIYFDGVYKESEVWLNGHYLGKRPNGFIAFQYELSPYLNFGGQNVLAVKVDHSQFADSRWYTGSGIYRNVYLVIKQPVHIGQWGVSFTTPECSPAKAIVNVNITVVNGSGKKSNVTLTCKLVDAQHKIVASATKNINSKSADSTVTAITFNVKDPMLWSVDAPNLYKMVATLTAAGQQSDEWTAKLGIRSLRFDADSGFYLNGKNMKLKGVCLHDDAGALGVAVPEEVWYRRLKLLKEGGCNAIRLSHNPHASYLYDLCDELGLLVMDEAFDEWEFGKNKWIEAWNTGRASKDGYHEYFKDWFEKDLGDMIRRDRNHPSVIMWSIGNEIDYPNDPYSDSVLNTGRNPQIYGKGYLPGNPPAKRLGDISKLMADVIKKYDTTRFITAALAGVVMSNKTDFPGNLDAVGYNYQEYRYKEDHKTYPKRIIYGSENSMELSAWNAVDTNAFIAGQFLWTGIDYLGESLQWPDHANPAGLLDLAGFSKAEYYFRQSLWSDKPMIYIGTSVSNTAPDGTSHNYRRQQGAYWNYQAGETVRVSCYTNCAEAELFLNGKSLGTKMLSQFPGRIIFWDVPYHPGELVVKGFAKNGTALSDSIKTTGAPYAITAWAAITPDYTGTSQLIIHVVDKNGNIIYGAANEITVKVSGSAKLTGLEDADIDNQENYKSNSRKVFHGNLIAYIKASATRGPAKVTVESPGLRTAVWRSDYQKK